jgi:hypothetical protein
MHPARGTDFPMEKQWLKQMRRRFELIPARTALPGTAGGTELCATFAGEIRFRSQRAIASRKFVIVMSQLPKSITWVSM